MRIFGIIAGLILTIGISVKAQQLPLYSQYMFNDFVINPAVAGTKEFIPITMVVRDQWVGFEGQPKTQTLSAHGALNNKNVGVGGYVFYDQIGPVTTTGLSGAYAYHLKSGNSKLSFGLSALMYLYRLNTSALQFDNIGNVDNVVAKNSFQTFAPNFSFGMHYSIKGFFAGISIPEILQTKLLTNQDFFVMQTKRHYFVNTGYNYEVNDKFQIEPSVLVKYVAGAPIEIDINARVKAYEKIFAGVSYRTNDAIVALAGFNILDQLQLGYSYDITTTAIKLYSKGSHEIMLRYAISEKGGSAKLF